MIFVSGRSFGEHAGDALQRAAGAESGDPVVEALAFEVVEDLLGGRSGVEVGVGFVLELAGEEPAVRLGEFDGFGDHAGAAAGGWGDDDFRAEEAHQPAALDAEGLGHGDDERVALLCAHHGEADAGVAAGGLDHGLAGLELAAALGIFDDSEGETVFDGAERVEGFDLDVEIDVGRAELVDANDGSVADGFKDVGVTVSHSLLLRGVQR